MDNISAFAMGAANQGKEPMVFDWDKAVEIIKEKNIKNAGAGLDGDFEYTAGMILENGKPYTSDYTYLASTWATPQLIIYDAHGDIEEAIDCFVMQSQTKYGSGTQFPEHLISKF